MSQTLYINSNTAIVNFNQGFPNRTEEIINSNSFKLLLNEWKQAAPSSLIKAISNKVGDEDIVDSIIDLTRLLYVYPLESIDHVLIKDTDLCNDIVEDVYKYWRSFQRCSITHLGKKSKSELINFIDTDTEFNNSILKFYRGLQEKIKGRKNKIYRQLKAGTNASITLREKQNLIPEAYASFRKLHFVDSVLLHSPLILHPKTNKREGHFQEATSNPISHLDLAKDEFYCYPAKIGTLLAYVYFHKDFIFSGISLSNLFELVTTEEIGSKQPDIMIAFGVDDQSSEMTFHIDEDNKMVVAKIAYTDKIEYFGYMKKIMLTAYNVYMMHKGWLPIHGSMVNVTTKDNKTFGIAFMGDSGAGKSEIIEELGNVGSDHIDEIEVIFDDMGVFHEKDGVIVAQGTEIGAFVRLDDLDRGLPYQQMDRSIFMNPESANNARVIVPVSDYKTISGDHKVDFFLYANNYDDKIGADFFDNIEDAKDTFVMGRRMAMATTHEVGLSTSYFANPFGPLQKQDVCDPLIDHYFSIINDTPMKIGQVYTNLGVSNRDEDSLKKSAQAVLELLK